MKIKYRIRHVNCISHNNFPAGQNKMAWSQDVNVAIDEWSPRPEIGKHFHTKDGLFVENISRVILLRVRKVTSCVRPIWCLRSYHT